MQASWNTAEIRDSESTPVLTSEREYGCKWPQGPDLPPALLVPGTQGPGNAEQHTPNKKYKHGTSGFQSHPSDAGQFSMFAQ